MKSPLLIKLFSVFSQCCLHNDKHNRIVTKFFFASDAVKRVKAIIQNCVLSMEWCEEWHDWSQLVHDSFLDDQWIGRVLRETSPVDCHANTLTKSLWALDSHNLCNLDSVLDGYKFSSRIFHSHWNEYQNWFIFLLKTARNMPSRRKVSWWKNTSGQLKPMRHIFQWSW